MITRKGKEDLEHYKSYKTVLLTVLIAILLFIKFDFGFDFFANLLFFYLLIVLCVYDLKLKQVPDYLLLSVLVLSFFITNLTLEDSVNGALSLAGAMFLLNFVVTFYIQNIKANLLNDDSLRTKEALGEGDIPLIASFGVIFGTFEAMFVVFISAIIGLFYAIFVIFRKNEKEIAYIPVLFVAFILEYFLEISGYLKDLY